MKETGAPPSAVRDRTQSMLDVLRFIVFFFSPFLVSKLFPHRCSHADSGFHSPFRGPEVTRQSLKPASSVINYSVVVRRRFASQATLRSIPHHPRRRTTAAILVS